MPLFNRKRTQSQPATTLNRAGGTAFVQDARMQLVSLVLTSFARDQFYRSASQTFDELRALLGQVDPGFAARAAVYARSEYGLRSITQVLAAELAPYAAGQPWARAFYDRIVTRPDDMLEIAAYYLAKQPGKMLPNAMKHGFARAFARFDGYQLAKYRGEGAAVKLVDLVNLVRPTPTAANADALAALVRGTLRNEATWEARLSAAGQAASDDAADKAVRKADVWGDLLAANKLGYLALLRNARNIAEQAPDCLVMLVKQLRDEQRIRKSRVLPFQFLAALDAVEQSAVPNRAVVTDALNDALETALANVPRFPGRTLVVLDDSGSMTAGRRAYANRTPIALGALFAAVLFKANDADLMRFSDDAAYVGERRHDSAAGIAERLVRNARSAGTNFNAIFDTAKRPYDRIVVLSDMQGWIGGGAPVESFARYRQRTGANPFVYSFDLQGYGSLQFAGDRVFALAGFSEKVFDVMRVLETDREALVKAIQAVTME